MLKRIEYYLPGLSQCWTLVFFLCVVGGLGAGAATWIITKATGKDMMEFDMLLYYLIPFLPAAAYIYFKGNERIRYNRAARQNGYYNFIYPSVPVDKPVFGAVPPVLFFVLLAFLTVALAIAAEPLSSWLPMPESIRELFEKLLTGNSLSAVLSTVAAAPLLEELLCRGIMERGLLFHSTPRKAILWSAFFFAFIHMNPWQAIPAFVIGILLGWIYWRTHSLWACIFVHFVNNGSIYACILLFPEMKTEEQIKDVLPPNIYPIVYVVCLIFTVLSILFLHKKLGTGSFDPVIRPHDDSMPETNTGINKQFEK